ncbi:MAG: AAA family ATPase [Gammaproteobacteria bacterium]|nr:AAA family ATPase [Gammaproteobacteria bacterium]
MQENHTSLGNKAFGDGSFSLTTVKYRSHIDALKAVEFALHDTGGISLLGGPDGAGKTTILREFSLHLANETEVVFVDGSHLKPHQLLAKMLAQLGGDVHAGSDQQMFAEVERIVSERARSRQLPVMIIDNADRLYPSSLAIVNQLAGIEVNARFAIRFILAGHETLPNLVNSDGLDKVAQRNPGSYSLGPLSAKETMIYLHARMQAAGSERADTIFPFDVCDRLREQSGGWPGKLNRFALEAITRSSGFPLSVVDTISAKKVAKAAADLPVLGRKVAASRQPPRLVISRNGKKIGEYVIRDKKVLLGRSDFADVIVNDDFVSKMHAVFLLYSDALVLLDLNSANGTTVNSATVGKTILRSDDVISLGNHRVKVENAPPVSAEMEELMKSPDTLKMKNLIDLRRLRAKRQIKLAGKN